MPGKPTEPAQDVDQVERKQPLRQQHGIKSGNVVSLRREVDVARITSLATSGSQLIQEEPRHEIETAEAAADVT